MAGATRRYESRHRNDQAQRTRLAVLAAAGACFTRSGFAATTIRDIAEAAGVSAETVYKGFGSKPALLRCWVDDCVAGRDEPVPVIDQRWVAELDETRDPGRRLAIAARAVRTIHDRAADAMAVLASAAHADAAAAELWTAVTHQRLSDVRAIVTLLVEGGSIDRSLPPDEVVDIAYALTEPHLYRTLVVDRGWSPERYEAWLADLLWDHLAPRHDEPIKEENE